MKKTIFLIEDNEGDQFLIKEVLEDNYDNYELILNMSGEDAIQKLNSSKPDIAIVDTQLPGIDGFETCKLLKEKYGNSIKVIVMTGVIDAIDAIKAREMGADEYCVKTSDLGELVKVLKEVTF